MNEYLPEEYHPNVMSQLSNTDRWARYFSFLDDLRKSGVTNMWGAGPYLDDAFGLKGDESTPILVAWMKTFSDEAPEIRVAKHLNAKTEA